MTKKKKIPSPDDINKIIDEVIDYYARGDVKRGVEGVKELAQLWKSSGQSEHSFREICQYMEDEAVEQAGDKFLRIQIRGELLTQTEDKIIVH